MFRLIRRTSHRIARSEVSEIVTCTIALLMHHYRVLVKNIDYNYVHDRISDWADLLEDNGCSERVGGSLDGKAWSWSRMGSDSDGAEAFTEFMQQNGHPAYRANWLQMAFYNGHYRAHGAKIQHLVLANGMVHAFPFSVRMHDYRGFCESPLEWQVQLLEYKHGPGATQPIRILCDQAYASNEHLLPFTPTATLRSQSVAQAAANRAIDEANEPFRIQVENTYSKMTTLWPFLDYKRLHQLVKAGKLDFEAVTDRWMAAVLFTNIHTCFFGSQVTSGFRVEPPTVREYLHSTNTGQMVAARDL